MSLKDRAAGLFALLLNPSLGKSNSLEWPGHPWRQSQSPLSAAEMRVPHSHAYPQEAKGMTPCDPADKGGTEIQTSHPRRPKAQNTATRHKSVIVLVSLSL